jgi:hypothetical protein
MGCFLLLAAICVTSALPASDPEPLAAIRLQNPTPCSDPGLVEVPLGSLAAPGEIDWARVRLTCDGREVPFALREGRPHWKSQLIAPIVQPRAEDLLVFSLAIPPRGEKRIDVVPGPARKNASLLADKGRLAVAYPNLTAVVEQSTGRLIELTAYGQSLLAETMTIDCCKLEGRKPENRQPLVPKVTLVSSAAADAMSELDFLLETPDGLETSLTYRIHAFGLLEIVADDRPKDGPSPWLDHRIDCSLRLAGEQEPLPYLQNSAPDYGFPDYAAAVKFVAAFRRHSQVMAVELGEETINGRQWKRRVYLVPPGGAARAERLAELADKGFVVLPKPRCAAINQKSVAIIQPKQAQAATEVLLKAFHRVGLTASEKKDAAPGDLPIRLELLPESDAAAITGDGFFVQRCKNDNGVRIAARTQFGLMQAALRIAENLAEQSGAIGVPLIASNPAVDLRAGGFGGGPLEVDFPYGTPSEWNAVLDRMIDSGMNVMTDLGMWSNWKMPVTYKYMPELQSDDVHGYDEVSGTPLAEIENYRRDALEKLDYLHDRGVKTWLWLPIGAVPTTYAKRFPEAMSPSDRRAPCYTHPKYEQFLSAFLREIRETYPIDGIVMIRDDNGGICRCPKCTASIAESPTRDAAWQQYLLLHKLLRSTGFQGAVAVYPYYDSYRPELDPLLPDDLLVVGHGSGAGVPVRRYDHLGPMGDTWLDNLHASFRPPTAARMKRLLADRPSFWIGGAYESQEMPWEAIGYFGWTPTATVNSFRYRWGAREFGKENAPAYVDLGNAHERLWDIYNVALPPRNWVKLSAEERKRTAEDARSQLDLLRERLGSLRAAAPTAKESWFSHVELNAAYFEYLLRRMERFSEMLALVRDRREILATEKTLAEDERRQLIAAQQEIGRSADDYDQKMAKTPGKMLAATREAGVHRPFRELTASFPLADQSLDVKQFAGRLDLSADALAPGQPFVLRVTLRNEGVYAWQPDAGQGPRLEFTGDADRLGLPQNWQFSGDWMVFGDRRDVELRGTVPQSPGRATVVVTLLSPFGGGTAIARQTIDLEWKQPQKEP